jgi:hypothetical protein
MSENTPDAEIRMPVTSAAANPMASPASTAQRTDDDREPGSGIASPPKPTRKSLSIA